MNDHELKQRLDQLRIPPPAEGAKERAWHRAELAFVNRTPESDNSLGRWGFKASALALAGCVLIATAFVLGRWSSAPSASDELRLLSEFQRLFPGQLQAVIRSGDRTEIVTSAEATTFSDQPLLVELREGGQWLRIVSFSGQRITAQLAGRAVTLEFLVTPAGAVIVAGDSFVWQSDRPHPVGDLAVEARRLTASL
jgi:hypothetical protein